MEYENLVALTSLTTKTLMNSSAADYKENKCVVANESDGEANTRTQSTDYNGFYVELCGEKLTRNAI